MIGNVFDCEANGLNPSRVWCLSANKDGKVRTTSNLRHMRSFLTNTEILVGHNIMRWDIPHLERLLGIKVKAKIIDTLALSWYLEPTRLKHGLEDWGEFFGIPKPVVVDWDDPSLQEVYEHRCAEDVKINTKLWERQWKQLLRLYGSPEEAMRFIDYLMFKMDCAREQEAIKWKLDVAKATKGRDELVALQAEKVKQLAEVMPMVPIISKKTRPAKPFKMSGEPSVHGENWFKLLDEKGLPRDYDGVVEVVVGYSPPNPGSMPQIKSWLFSLGWVPETFKYDRNKETNEVRKIEQVNVKGEGLCPSVVRLIDIEPNLAVLEGLYVLNHRISILNGFLDSVDEDGYVIAGIQGLTNTLRFKHRVVLNLPGIDKPYGELVRGCLIAPEGYELVGSDMASLEDRTKQHYMWPYDPEYVKAMMVDDFDPHLDLAIFAKAVPQDVVNDFKRDALSQAIYKEVKGIRSVYKAVNYACVYGAQGPTVARAAGVTEAKGRDLVDKYWERNWSVLKIAEDCLVKNCLGSKWLFNPVSKFWYSLRHEKDRFSTLNQGTGVYCFDTWVKHVRNGGPPIIGQIHDEVVGLIRTGLRDKCITHFKNAIRKTNDELKLNRDLDISIQFGSCYADIH